MNISEIVKLFITDTFICSNGTTPFLLREFMMEKHGWSFDKFKEYRNIYQDNMLNITVK